MLLYSSDSPPAEPSPNNLISIQLDSITLNKIVAEAKRLGKIEKKINFRDVNGFPKLVKGESSRFSFFEDSSKSVCDVSCDVKCKQVSVPTTAPPPKPFFVKKQSATGPPYLPPFTKKDEAVTPQTTRKPLAPVSTKKPYFPTSYQTSTQRPTVKITRSYSTASVTSTPKTTVQTTRSNIPGSRPRASTPGPTYLPVPKKTTVRRSTVTERSYPRATWPSTTRTYTQTFPTWNAPSRRSTVEKLTTSTPKYLYKAPSNSLIYAGEAE